MSGQSPGQPLKQTTTDAQQGNTGGDWSWCTHIVVYGYNFDEGLASFLAFQLTPTSAFEFGSGIGLYGDYLVRHGKVAGKVLGAEPSDMQGAGVFGRPGIEYPQQLMMNILEATDEERSAVGKFDLVYTIEVAEHVPAELHRVMRQVLKSLTTKYLVFAAARPGQGGTGHLGPSMFTREEWKVHWERTGLFYLEGLSEILRRQCDPYNTNHGKNLLVFGVSKSLDTTVEVSGLTRNVEMKKEKHEANALRLFPFMLDAKIKSRECGSKAAQVSAVQSPSTTAQSGEPYTTKHLSERESAQLNSNILLCQANHQCSHWNRLPPMHSKVTQEGTGRGAPI